MKKTNLAVAPTTRDIEITRALDEGRVCQENIAAIAELLWNCSSIDKPELSAICGAGRILFSEAEKLKAMFDMLDEHCERT
jgi:hypothetical protein